MNARVGVGSAQGRTSQQADPGFMDVSEGLASLGFAIPAGRVMVERDVAVQVDQAINTLRNQGYRAGQAVPDPGSGALIALQNLGLIRPEDYAESCRVRVLDVAAAQQRVTRQSAGRPVAQAPASRLARWGSTLVSDVRKSKWFPQTRWSTFFLAALPVHMWGAAEFLLFGSAKATAPGEPRRLLGYQVGGFLPLGLIPALLYFYLRGNTEALARRQAGSAEPDLRESGPHNI